MKSHNLRIYEAIYRRYQALRTEGKLIKEAISLIAADEELNPFAYTENYIKHVIFTRKEWGWMIPPKKDEKS